MTDLLMRSWIRLQTSATDLRKREEGQTTTEYAILLGFLAIAIIVAIVLLKDVLIDLFTQAADSVSSAPGVP